MDEQQAGGFVASARTACADEVVQRVLAGREGKIVLRKSLFVTALAVLCLSVGVAVASAGGGNSANAKLCQKNGWQSLYKSDGTTFTSETDCVSYAAQGGTILTAPPKTQSQIDCEGFGGTFSTDPATNISGFPNTGFLWSCDGVDLTNEQYGVLAFSDCFALDGGNNFGRLAVSFGNNWSCLKV